MVKMIEFYEAETRSKLKPNPTEAELSQSFDVASQLLASIRGQTKQKRQRRDAQIKICTLVRMLREENEPKYRRPFKRRKRVEESSSRRK